MVDVEVVIGIGITAVPISNKVSYLIHSKF